MKEPDTSIWEDIARRIMRGLVDRVELKNPDSPHHYPDYWVSKITEAAKNLFSNHYQDKREVVISDLINNNIESNLSKYGDLLEFWILDTEIDLWFDEIV